LQGLRGSRDKLFPLSYPWGGLFLILGMMDGNCLGNKPKPEIWMLDSGNILPGGASSTAVIVLWCELHMRTHFVQLLYKNHRKVNLGFWIIEIMVSSVMSPCTVARLSGKLSFALKTEETCLCETRVSHGVNTQKHLFSALRGPLSLEVTRKKE
jgi:hypothetical protein